MEFLFDNLETPKVYTISELTRKIKSLLDREIGEVHLTGEVSRPVYHSSGHVYFTIKDASSQIDAACFRNVARRLKFKIEHGQEVLVFGRVSVYEPRGRYQIIVTRIEPKGVGALQLAFEQLKERLAKEGLFDEDRKKEIPFLPRAIGIVTSPTGAAVRDILNIIDRRFPDVRIVIHPVKVQGEGAAEEIAAAIETFNAAEELADVEVLIVGRGGGSIEDLWAFNEERVARAVAASRLPVISAVGHEIDFTITDFVADLRAPTPSAAAELVLPERADLDAGLKKNRRRLALALQNRLKKNKMDVLKIYRSYAFRNPMEPVRGRAQLLDELARRTESATGNLLALRSERLSAAAGRLESLSPLAVLSRGYSVTTPGDGRRAVRDAAELEPGSMIKTRFHKGAAISRVEKVEKNGKE
jgi:exodeoxyribonuclease VII large subunit